MAAAVNTLKAFAVRFAQRGRDVGKAVERATDRHADLIVERGKANAPRQTGRLAASIHKENGPSVRGTAQRDVVADAPYAAAVHNRPPEEDTAHEGETTPEGYPGREFFSRPLRFHQGAFVKGVLAGTMAALRGETK